MPRPAPVPVSRPPAASPRREDMASEDRTPRRWSFLLGVTCIMLAARTSDLFITRVHDRALEREQNVLHVHYGAGWSELIVVNLVVVFAAACLFAYSVWHPRRLPPGLDFSRFVGYLYWSRPVPWWQAARTPFQPGWSWCVGRAAPWILVGSSLLVNAGNLMGHTAWGQHAWHFLVGSTPALLATLFGMVAVSLWAWHKAEHLAYRLAPTEPAGRAGQPGAAVPVAGDAPSGTRPRAGAPGSLPGRGSPVPGGAPRQPALGSRLGGLGAAAAAPTRRAAEPPARRRQART